MCQYLLVLHLLTNSSSPAACVRTYSWNARKNESKKLEVEICRVYEASIYEIWEKTQLHMAYIRNDPSFWKMLSSAKKPEIEETDATEEDLLQMAAGNGDIHLGTLGMVYTRASRCVF